MYGEYLFYAFPKLQSEMTEREFHEEWESRKALAAKLQARKKENEARRDLQDSDDEDGFSDTDSDEDVDQNPRLGHLRLDQVPDEAPVYDASSLTATLPDRAEHCAAEFESAYSRCKKLDSKNLALMNKVCAMWAHGMCNVGN